MPKHINTFDKGLISDLDYTRRPSGSWDFPTENVRLLNKDNQGLVLTSIKGTEKKIELDSGYSIIGATSYKGFVFIISHNDATGKTQIGSFPSYYEHSSGRVNEYNTIKVIKDTLSGSFSEFNQEGFGYSSSSELDVFAKEEYDNTFSIYICDGETPNRIINTGFGVGGYNNDRYYTEANVEARTNQFLLSSSIPTVTLSSIDSNGKLNPGNYFFFIRYTTENYDSTVFFSHLGPVQLGIGTNMITAEGGIEGTETNRSVTITLSGLDTSYDYFEIGVLRYSGEFNSGEDSAIVAETYIIDKYFPITQDSVTIFGTESQRIATLADLMSFVSPEISSKTHTHIQNVYWGGNWKAPGYDRDYLAGIAQKVTAGWITSDIPDAVEADYQTFMSTGDNKYSQHQSPFITLNTRSHFRGEIYPYAIVFTFGGIHTEAFPVVGYDWYSQQQQGNSNKAITNNKGLMVMPFYREGNDITGLNNMSSALGIRFNLGELISEINKYGGVKPDGFYIVRGDRIPNLMFQGLMVQAFNQSSAAQLSGYTYLGENYIDGGASISEEGDSRFIPLLTDKLAASNWVSGASTPTYGTRYVRATSEKYALFSPDYAFMIDTILQDDQQLYLQVFNDPKFEENTSSGITPDETYFEGRYNFGGGSNAFSFSSLVPVKAYNVDALTYNAGGGFTSKFADYKVSSSEYGVFNVDSDDFGNRSIKTMKYIGIIPDQPVKIWPVVGYTSDDRAWADKRVANLYRYKTKSDYINSSFSNFTVGRTFYRKATQLITPIWANSFYSTYAGDAFVQRTFLRAQRYYHYNDDVPMDTGGSFFYKHGAMFSIVTENALNTAMRSEVAWEDDTESGIYSYYPRCLFNTPSAETGGFAALNTGDDFANEALYINPGYSRDDLDPVHRGYDEMIPYYNSHRKSRIRHSIPNAPFSFANGYRVMEPSAYVDADIAGGAVTAVRRVNDELVVVSENKVQQYSINEKAIRAATTDGELVMGTGPMIHPTPRTLAEFGSEKTASVYSTGMVMYGMSLSRGIVWRCFPERSQSGYNYLVAEDIGQKLLCSQSIQSKIKDVTGESYVNDIVESSNIKACTGFNPELGEVYLTALDSDTGKSITLLYSQRLGMMVGTVDIAPTRYVNSDRFMFSMKGGKGYQHDVNNACVLHEEEKDITFSFVVNGLVGETNDSLTVKSYNSMLIEIRKEDLVSVDYICDGQEANFTPQNKFWEGTRYYEGKLAIPIIRQTGPTGYVGYGIGSLMRGTWMKVTVKMNASTQMYVRNIVTDYKHSM